MSVNIIGAGKRKHENEIYRLHVKSLMNEYSGLKDIQMIGSTLSSVPKIKLLQYLSEWRTYKDITIYFNITIFYARVMINELHQTGLIVSVPYRGTKKKKMKLKYDRLIINFTDDI